ncbi:MAG: RodZ domain-containing protein [Alphaproteobacteria bacterium]
METKENQQADKKIPSIGILLKAARERKGQTLETITNALCIRLKHLQAIEGSKYEDLPGKTYAIGFVKSYAEYLGLDGDEIVRLFKEEVAELKKKQELYPLDTGSEASVPNYFTVFVGLAVAFLVYFGWSHLGSFNDKDVAIIEEVPEDIEEIVADQPETPEFIKDKEPEQKAEVSNTVKEIKKETKKEVEVAENEGEKTPEVAEKKEIETKKVEEAVVDVVEAVSEPEIITDNIEEIAEVVVEPEIVDIPLASSAELSAEKNSQNEVSTAPETAETIVTEPEKKEHIPQVYGQENSTSRVTIKANSDSWVHVIGTRETGEEIIFISKLFYTGDSYQLPNRNDLFLDTGNAGGLSVSVDGADLGALGPNGAVKRKIPLSPEELLKIYSNVNSN